MARCKEPLDLDSVDEALGNLITSQIKFGREALRLLTDGCGSAMDTLTKMNIPGGKSCCDIPEPCWMPKNLGEICCQLCPGDVGEVCFIVANNDFRAHSYQVVVAGEHANLVQLDSASFNLGAKERRVVSAKFKMPLRDTKPTDSCCKCNDYEAVIWVQGCQNHYLNWYLNSEEKTRDCCFEVCVNDQPDNELHWYDHFHIARPCPGPITGQSNKR